MTIQPEAITAAARAVHDDPAVIKARLTDPDACRRIARVTLEAAAPLIAAAERDRIGRLAIETNAQCHHLLCRHHGGTEDCKQFADLIFADLIGSAS